MKHFLLFLTLALPATAQLQPNVDAYIERARVTWEVPGIAVTVVRDGNVVAAKGYGVRRLGSPERVDENTMFDIASLSKSFTAAAIATLVDEGKMRWDDPVRRWLPYVEFSDSYRTANVTIRDLLSHRVGVEAGNWMFRITDYSTEEVLRRVKYLKEREPFRTSMLYSNVGYTAAGEAAAAAAKMPYVDLVRTRLIEPLGMRDSTVGVEHALAPNHVSPHERIDGVLQPIRNKKAMNILPANAVNSTAKDLARWLLFSLGDGIWNDKGEGKRIVSPESMREMQSPQTIIATTPQMRAARNVQFFAAYGLGWQIMDYRGHAMLWHSGNADGMPVYMCILPVEKIGVAVMLNSAEAQALHGTIASRILDSLLGVPPQELPQPPSVTIQPDPPREQGTSPSRPITAYAGVYNDPLYGDLTISESDGKLVLQFARGDKADLTHWQYDTFRVRWHDRAYEWADTLAVFGLDASGNPRRLDMKLYRDMVEAVRK